MTSPFSTPYNRFLAFLGARDAITKQVLDAMIGISFVTICIFGCLYLVLSQGLPDLAALYAASHVTPPLVTKLLFTVSTFLAGHSFLFGALFGCLATVCALATCMTPLIARLIEGRIDIPLFMAVFESCMCAFAAGVGFFILVGIMRAGLFSLLLRSNSFDKACAYLPP